MFEDQQEDITYSDSGKSPKNAGNKKESEGLMNLVYWEVEMNSV